MDALVIKNLRKITGGSEILHSLNFSLPIGVICAFVGANGAGKTTTIKDILGLYPKSSGEILIMGSPNNPESRANIGYIPEKENFPKTKVYSFLKEMGEYAGLDENTISKKISYYADLFKFSEILYKKLPNLSSGQKKKIMIVQAIMSSPKILLADEPTENLDPETREIFYQEILRLNRENNMTIFVSTHNLDEIQNYLNYLVVIDQGNIKYSGSFNNKKSILRTFYKECLDSRPHIQDNGVPTSTTSVPSKTDSILSSLSEQEKAELKSKLSNY